MIAEPDNLTFDLEQIQPRFLILATDGLWDAFSNEEAVSFVSSVITCEIDLTLWVLMVSDLHCFQANPTA